MCYFNIGYDWLTWWVAWSLLFSWSSGNDLCYVGCFLLFLWWADASRSKSTLRESSWHQLSGTTLIRFCALFGFWPAKRLLQSMNMFWNRVSGIWVTINHKWVHKMYGHIQEAYYVRFRTIPATDCDSRAHQVYKTKEDVMIQPWNFVVSKGEQVVTNTLVLRKSIVK